MSCDNILYKNSEEQQSVVIQFLRFPLSVMAVFIHSFGAIDGAIAPCMVKDYSGIDWYNIIRILFSHVFPSVAVPTFFFISGYLFFYKTNMSISSYMKKINSRIRTLLVPYILWISIYILSFMMLRYILYLRGCGLNIVDYFKDNGWLDLYWSCNVWEGSNNIWRNWYGMESPAFSAPALVPFWFVRDLMMMVVISPIIYFLIKKNKNITLTILSFCYLTNLWIPITGININGLFFFTMGSYLAIKRKNILDVFRRVKLLCYVLYLVLLPIMIYYDASKTVLGATIYPFFVLIGVIVVFNIADQLLYHRLVKPLFANTAFFIYAFHGIWVVELYHRISTILTDQSCVLYGIILYLSVPIFSIITCLIVYYIMRRYASKILAILTGERVS